MNKFRLQKSENFPLFPIIQVSQNLNFHFSPEDVVENDTWEKSTSHFSLLIIPV